MCFIYSYRHTHTNIYTHVAGNLCMSVHDHKHTSGKHQHCKILVRFFFTHHWLHLFPSLDLDYVTVREAKEVQCVKIQRRKVMLDGSLSHTFSRKKSSI